jgi:hypothetical protein
MILNNKKRTITLQLRRFLFLFLLAAIIAILFYVPLFSNPVFGIDRQTYAFLFTGIFLLYYLTGIVRNYQFFYYTDNGSKLVFRYYSLRPLSKKQNSIEIDKKAFVGFKIDRLFFSFIIKLYLYQKLPNGAVAKYPPVNISLLNKKEVKLLEISLNDYRQ